MGEHGSGEAPSPKVRVDCDAAHVSESVDDSSVGVGQRRREATSDGDELHLRDDRKGSRYGQPLDKSLDPVVCCLGSGRPVASARDRMRPKR